MFSIALIAVAVLIVVAMLPKKPTPQPAVESQIQAAQPMVHQLEPMPMVQQFETLVAKSMREMQLDEESAALSEMYRDRANEVYRADLAKTASALFAGKTPAKS
ncbi:hypothetical protein K227x_64410 [Rubripirellula lacrimiformis]|uniref:Uncharacterized protein n=1 Tax=Rubripirellula lacrimiformis TaxID=1930273 RepID=A0A517NLK1_9BACT|nr:hypothetical protein [Rubripirellula lacrimiformis]QDT08011.1 hypothetical protein K227x_64410 [Rubripirellula lacrimiformis]